MTTAKRRPKLMMFVLNELIYDARVLKSANSLSRDYEVLLVGVWLRKFDIDQEAEQAKWPFKMAWVDIGRAGGFSRNLLGYGLRFAQIFRGVRALGVDFKPDFVHAHELASLPIGRAIQKATGAKLIYDAHELYRDTAHGGKWYWKILAWMETKLMASCDGIIACNEDRARIMQEVYGAPFRPTVIHNMPLPHEYAESNMLREKLGDKAAGLRQLVLYQGAIMPGRGLEMLPRALLELPAHIGVVLVGGIGQKFKSDLGDLALELGVQDRFFLLPAVPQTELFPYTCSADVGIVTYQNTCLNNYYCAPNKLYEYSMAGLPMVGSDLPPVRAYLEDNEVGEVFDAEDPASLAQAINTVCGDEEVHRKFRANCFTAASRFTWQARSEVDLRQLYASYD